MNVISLQAFLPGAFGDEHIACSLVVHIGPLVLHILEYAPCLLIHYTDPAASYGLTYHVALISVTVGEQAHLTFHTFSQHHVPHQVLAPFFSPCENV